MAAAPPTSRLTRLLGSGLVFLLFAAGGAQADGECRYPKRPPVTLKNMGPCDFDAEALQFKGTPAEQAACLARPVYPFGRIAREPASLPAAFARRVGTALELPQRREVAAYARALGFAAELGNNIEAPVARAENGDPGAPEARYFVIHDTSAPNFAGRPFPQHIDWDRNINSLARHRCTNNIERAHYFINRRGQVLRAHDFGVPWRATKFEMATQFGSKLRGLFLHIELIQPRRRAPRHGRHNDFEAPLPGFSAIQYERLALVYVVASVRAGHWLIPAFHAVIDEGIADKHDDPQNFEFAKFDAAIGKLLHDMPAAVESARNYVP